VSSTPAPPRNYRWTILGEGVFAQAAFSAILLGLPAIAPAIQDRYALSLTQVGVVLAALNIADCVWLVLAKKGTTSPTSLSYEQALEGGESQSG
jgi:hypothetical protein